MRSNLFTLLFALLTATAAKANICGTDFQNFNPTTNGLDFVTVQSSETLKPCIINMGVFLNYAANTLSYSQNYTGSTAPLGTKANDRILGADLSLGVGLTKRWDVGVSFPFVVGQEIKDQTGVTFYEKRGLTEVKVNTKFRFTGDDSGGLAAVLSLNHNVIADNPFVGANAGLTTNLELVADTIISSWALAVNLGYRWRKAGDPVPNQPFLPLKDQIIYSAAASYLMKDSDNKFIFEVFGSRAAKSVDYDANRSLNAAEWLAGFKHDFSHAVAFHVGGGTQIGKSLGSPDWRLYTGLNWALGPICGKEEEQVQKVEVAEYKPVPAIEAEPLPPIATGETFEGKLPEVYRFNAEVLFDTDSAKIRNNHMGDIENLIRDLARTGFKKLQIDGHTDSVGREEYNMDLSERRATSVKNYIVEKYNVIAARITTQGYGESRPIADNGNFQGRQKNRRVEFKVWK